MNTARSVLLCGVLAACGAEAPPPGADGMSLNDALGSALGSTDDGAGFTRATEPPALEFPRDHGAHRAFRTEWWYVTGNVATDEGRRFGVQLVFFRQALAANATNAANDPPRAASLAARETILAHAAVTDAAGRVFRCDQRLARVAAGLGDVRGGDGAPFTIVCADWSATAQPGGDGFLPLALHASGDDFAFDLVLEHGKAPVLQGDRGLSQKSELPGNASIYYSMTRLPITGTVRTDRSHRVRGEAWLDREWSTSALAPEQVGWDWFSLQLADGTELMWYQLRRRDGTIDRHSRGSFVARDGSVTPLLHDAVTATPSGEWNAPDGGARYPARWRLSSASPAFDLDVEPVLPDQELRLLVRYWEGAVDVRGTCDGAPVAGRGYLEMTGYAGPR